MSDTTAPLGFAELSLRPEILRSISEMGFETPSPIQAQAIPLMLGRDIDFLGMAGTGTGKTAAFAIPLLERIDTKVRGVQALILCPTRELAQQVAGQISLLGKYLRVKVATVYGGAPYGEQIAALRSGAQIVVGTPGRVIDHLERSTLNLDLVRTLILDEADEMFSMGFKEEIDRVVEMIAEGANTWLFSATMSPEVRRVVQSSLHDPVTVQVSKPNTLAAGVEQFFYRVNEPEKPEVVCKLIEAADEFYGLIFCQTKALVADLTRFMLDRGYKVDCLHGDMDQNSRERTMQAFRDKKLKVLICTDVAARGLDVKDVTHVVNYSLPRELESYVHRIGRTARSGKAGTVMNLVTFSHRHLLGRIEQHTRARMQEGFIPTKREIAAKKVARLLPVFADQPFASRVMDVMGEEFRVQLASMTQEEIASHFIVMMMPDIFGGQEARPRSAAKAKAAVAKMMAAKTAPVAVAQMPADESPVSPVQVAPNRVAEAAPEVSPSSVSPSEGAKLDLFGDEITEKIAEKIVEKIVETKKVASTLDQPPRSRKKPLDDDAIVSMLEAPPAFGVVKKSAREERPRTDRFDRQERGFRDERPRRDTGRYDRPSRPAAARGGDRFERTPRPSRLERADQAPSRPQAPRATAPMNLGKPPKHEAGPSRTARLGETGGLNRRARRALLFGRPLDGANESTH